MSIKKWKTLSRRDVLKHPRLHLVEDEVELPSGKTTAYLRTAPKKGYSVAVIAVNKAGEILLQREYSYPPDEVLWQPPGGGAKKGEDIITTAKRELAEESGFAAKDCEIIGYHFIDNRRSDAKQYVVLCRDLEPCDTNADQEEFIESHWLSVEEVKAKIRSGEITNMSLLAVFNIYLHTVLDT